MAEPIAFRWRAHLEPADLAGLGVLVAGLGRLAALRLASFGADVVACDDGEVGTDELEAAGIKVHTGGCRVELLKGWRVAWTPQGGAG